VKSYIPLRKVGIYDAMRAATQCLSIAILALATAVGAAGQSPAATTPTEPQEPALQNPASSAPAPAIAEPAPPSDAPSSSLPAPATHDSLAPAPGSPAVQLLRDFKNSDVKFEFDELMDILRDRRHEGWVLAAYPDPKTGHPLIGAGFSLDLPAREHPQLDPLNPHPFVEPSSADLWQAAGLDPDRLQAILGKYHEEFAHWSKWRFRRKIGTLEPQITDDDASELLRISIVQAIYNARAYCRTFDQLTASQQMAMTQLVYQMGVNLEEFSEFLQLINYGATAAAAPLPESAATDARFWKSVQESLIHSQWARLYRTRAVSVIAMLDPEYSEHPTLAERRIGATLRPAVMHRRRTRVSRQLASSDAHSSRARRRSSHTRTKRTA
jgi:GH24 family phage-related lysozyme (muramidase)